MKNRKPYIGTRRYKNFTVDYSMERLVFSFEYSKGNVISWTVDKDRILEYPNFQKMSKHDLWVYYVYTILPQMREYFNFMSWYELQ